MDNLEECDLSIPRAGQKADALDGAGGFRYSFQVMKTRGHHHHRHHHGAKPCPRRFE